MNNRNYFFLLWNAHTLFESLPISSSGHVQLLNRLLARFYKRAPFEISSHTEHLMHIPTLCVVGTFLLLERCPLAISASWTHLMICMALANLITGSCYLLLKSIKKPLLPLYVGFFITGCVLLSLYFVPPAEKNYISLTAALIIGIAQSVALLPGISRLAITVCVALWLGISPSVAFLFSLTIEWFLAAGAIARALLKELYDTKQDHKNPFKGSFIHYVSLFASSLISYALLKGVYYMILHRILAPFGWYMIALALITKKFL